MVRCCSTLRLVSWSSSECWRLSLTTVSCGSAGVRHRTPPTRERWPAQSRWRWIPMDGPIGPKQDPRVQPRSAWRNQMPSGARRRVSTLRPTCSSLAIPRPCVPRTSTVARPAFALTCIATRPEAIRCPRFLAARSASSIRACAQRPLRGWQSRTRATA